MRSGLCTTIVFVLGLSAGVTLLLMMAGMTEEKALLTFATAAFIGMAVAISIEH